MIIRNLLVLVLLVAPIAAYNFNQCVRDCVADECAGQVKPYPWQYCYDGCREDCYYELGSTN